MRSRRIPVSIAAFIAVAILCASCAGTAITPTPLSKPEFEALNIVAIEAKMSPTAEIGWATAENEYANLREQNRAAGDLRGYIAEKAVKPLKKALSGAFQDGPHGPRKARLEVSITKIHVVDAGEKIASSLMGGSFHSLHAEAVFSDAKTGAVIARTRDVWAFEDASGFGLSGAIGGIVRDEMRGGETHERLAAQYAQHLRSWLLPKG